MTQKATIISGSYANDLTEMLKSNDHMNHTTKGKGRHKSITVSARRCSRYTHARGVELTGGLVVKARITSSLISFSDDTFTRRLPVGWTDKQFRNAVHFVSLAVMKEAHRLSYVQQVDDIATTFMEKDTQANAVDEQIEKHDWNDSYDDMTIKQCEQWITWMNNFKA